MAKHIGNVVFGVFLLIVSIYMWFVADALPVFEKYQEVDSDFWPKILMTMIGLFSVGVISQSMTALRAEMKTPLSGSPQAEDDSAVRVNWTRFAVMGGLCIGYFYGLQTVGFLISTLVFLWISIAFIGLDGKFLRIFYPLIFTTALTILFVKVLELSLPRGQWIFREFSLLFY
jgi:putative tricarboxylic transport membrane protein